MASTEINGRIRHKRDTDLNWSIHNPILLDGEIIIVEMSDGSVRTKTGDGTNHYSQLSFNDGDLRTSVISLSDRVDTLDDEMDDRYTKSEIDSALNEKSDVSETVTVTLQADGWSDGIQTVAVPGLSQSQNGFASTPQNITSEQYEAITSAQLIITGQSDGALTFCAKGDTPVIDLPVVIIMID